MRTGESAEDSRGRCRTDTDLRFARIRGSAVSDGPTPARYAWIRHGCFQRGNKPSATRELCEERHGKCRFASADLIAKYTERCQ